MFHVCDLYGWFAGFIGNREWTVLHIAPDLGIIKFTANEALGIESGILRAGMEHAGVEIKIKGVHLRVLACWYRYGMARCRDCWEKPGRGMSAIVVDDTEG